MSPHLHPRPTIYVVDDDDGVRRALSRYLASRGFALREYASAEAFLDEKQGSRDGCLIFDFHLPGLNGLETLARVRSQGCALPVIIITGTQDSALEELARRSGTWAFLRKPIDPQILFSTVDEAVRVHSKSLQSPMS